MSQIVKLRDKAVMLLLCFFLLIPCHLRSEEVSSSNLMQYLEAVLTHDDVIFDLEESLLDAQTNIDIAKHRYAPRLVPVSNLGILKGAGSQSLGLEVKKETEFGSTITVGALASRSESNEYDIINSHAVKSYIQISQGLFRRWGKDYNLMGLTQSQLQLERQKILSELRVKKMIKDSVMRYYNVILAKKMISNTQRLLQKSKDRLEEVTIRYQAGLSSEFDVNRSALSVMNAENGLANWAVKLRRASENLTSNFVSGENTIFTINSEIKLMTPLIPQDWEKILPDQKDEWKMYLIDKTTGVLSRDYARQNLNPDISLNVSLSDSGFGDNFNQASRLNQTEWSVQLTYSDGFDLFQEEKDLGKQEVKLVKLERKGKLLKREIYRNAINAFEDFSAQERTYKASLAKRNLLEKSLESENIHYAHELSSVSKVIDAELAHAEAEANVIRASITYNLKAVELAYVLGILDLNWLRMSEKTLGGEAFVAE